MVTGREDTGLACAGPTTRFQFRHLVRRVHDHPSSPQVRCDPAQPLIPATFGPSQLLTASHRAPSVLPPLLRLLPAEGCPRVGEARGYIAALRRRGVKVGAPSPRRLGRSCVYSFSQRKDSDTKQDRSNKDNMSGGRLTTANLVPWLRLAGVGRAGAGQAPGALLRSRVTQAHMHARSLASSSTPSPGSAYARSDPYRVLDRTTACFLEYRVFPPQQSGFSW